ncbi:MAG: PQQ-binding-like beta-propeller repeat protein [Solirubrobacterales bacterium]|nr:PQQ-binding-like beta-propeller repeat protein [Solirubrobacterales bacterium]
MTAPRNRRALGLATLAALLLLFSAATASADWTTYRGDPTRSGVDSSSTGSVPFTAAWTSSNLGGDIWGQPLIHDGLVIVGTESDQVVALDESTGHVVWQASAGTPVPASKLPCGDISPNVGITSTPVIDPATGEVFVVADTYSGGTIDHKLYAFQVSNGAAVPGFPVDVEPPGDSPDAQLQRPALALDAGQIVIGYGGNDGDCSTYHGWLVSVSESGGSEHTFEVDQNAGDEGAIWGSGNGPAVDSSGDLWVSTGNGNSGSTYGYQESVLKLGPSLALLDNWAPSNWQQLDSSDTDIGSSAPILLPNNLVFEIGKGGLGYLLSASHLGGVGAAPAYPPQQVCSGSWGGGVYSGGVIYVSCSDGLHALALNASAPSYSPLASWHVPSSANGPPTVAGGLVWATDWNNAKLYGFNLQTGAAAVTQPTPAMVHFATPSASDGKLFLATGPTVEAYTIANPVSTPAPAPAPPNTCTLRLATRRIKIHHPKRRKHARRTPAPFGTVALVARCTQAADVTLSGTVSEQLGKKRRHHKARTRSFHLKQVRAAVGSDARRTLELRIPDAVLRALARATRRSGTFTLVTGGVRVVVRSTGLRL